MVPVTSAPSDGGGSVEGVDSCSPSGASPGPRGLLVLLAVLVEERGLVVVFLVLVFVILFIVVFLIIAIIVV